MLAYENMKPTTIACLAKSTGSLNERARMELVMKAKKGKMPKCVFNFTEGKLK